MEKKQEIVHNYDGQPKQELLTIIRKIFPLAETDKRMPNNAVQVLHLLTRAKSLMKESTFSPSEQQQKEIERSLKTLLEWLS